MINPHTNDRGQRFEMRYEDTDGNEKLIGWTDSRDGALKAARGFKHSPDVRRTWVIDRWSEKVLDHERKEAAKHGNTW